MSATAVTLGRTIVRVRDLAGLIDARPEGAKLDFPALIRALTPTQADLIAAVQELVDEGALDPLTLRVPIRPRRERAARAACPPGSRARNWGDRPSGIELAARIEAEGQRRGLLPAEISRQAFGNQTQLWSMRKGPRPVTRATLFKAEAWLAKAPTKHAPVVERERPQLAGEPAAGEDQSTQTSPAVTDRGCADAPPTGTGGGSAKSAEAPVAESPPPPAPVSGPTGADLAAEIEAAAHAARVPVSAFARPLLGRHCLQRIASVRQSKRPKPETVRMIREYLASRPAAAKSSRDVTSKPETPLMDLADRQRLNGQRHFAEIRRGQERSAAALLDAGVEPGSVKSSYTANTMRQIQQRREGDARQQDPVEQAKLVLRRRGRVVFDATVHGGRKGHFFVNGIRDEATGKARQLTGKELIDLAGKVGGSANSNSTNQQRRVG